MLTTLMMTTLMMPTLMMPTMPTMPISLRLYYQHRVSS
jgi:hypothetical protein